MLISRKDATQLASAWVRENMWFKGSVMCMATNAHNGSGGYYVDVRYKETYQVIKLLVVTAEVIQVIKDRQERVTKIAEKVFNDSFQPSLDPQIVFTTNLDNITVAIKSIWEENPEWFEDLIREEPYDYYRTHYLTVKMVGKKNRKADVQVKLFSSKAAKASFNQRLSDRDRLSTISLVAINVKDSESFKLDLITRIVSVRRGLRL